MTVHRRTHLAGDAGGHPVRHGGADSTRERRSQAERRLRTRRALLDAALDQLEAGVGFDSLSLRQVARAADVVPAAFYRHFASMDELGLVLMEESVLTLRAMLRQAREDQAQRADHLIARSVAILVSHVREHRRHFAFIAHARSSGNALLRHAIRTETKLFASELATDLARFPILRDWGTADLQMLAGMFVDQMIATIDSILEAFRWGAGPVTLSPETEAEITVRTERQLRLIALGIPHWRTRS
jgi:AcrR family transcriptional regulator